MSPTINNSNKAGLMPRFSAVAREGVAGVLA
jgi:hypothetical protein